MKKALICIILVSLCICMIPLPAIAAQSIKVNITSNISGADVYVDDDLVGVTPIENYTVIAGNHTVKVSLPGYITCEDTFSGNGTVILF